MLTQIPYQRELAVNYARQWALSRNPLFFDFSGRGGNCTSFVSQVLLAGCSVMDITPTFGWYYRSENDRAPAWSGVEALYDFLTSSNDFSARRSSGPFASIASNVSDIDIGDIIQLADESGDFYHSLVISDFSQNDVLVCAHSNDALDRPLSSYRFSSMRVLHVLGAYIDLPRSSAARSLTQGEAIRIVKGIETEVSESI